MDKFIKLLTALKKYQFWVVCGAVLLTAIVCWWLATIGLAGQFRQRRSKLEGDFKGVIIQRDHPNQGVIDKIRRQHEALKRGVYNADSRGLDATRLKTFFMRGTGANSGKIRVKPELQRWVEFRSLNLMDTQWQLGDPFHMVFCRNVMIYFDAPTQRKVLERIHRVMRPGGLLFVGHSENFTESRDLFKLRGKTIYERV